MEELKTLRLLEWSTPASSYKEEKVGKYCIDKHLCRGYYTYNGIEGYLFFLAKNDLTLTRLREQKNGSWYTWMVDSPPDYRAMQIYAGRAHGHVLIAGLGLGLLVYELCENDKVESITVVEISRPVISLIAKYLPQDNRIQIERENFWKYIGKDKSKWDTIIVDLWVFTDTQRHLEIYQEEIIPANEVLRSKYPEAQIIFHSFAGMPSVDQIKEYERNGGNPGILVYGLSEVRNPLHYKSEKSAINKLLREESNSGGRK